MRYLVLIISALVLAYLLLAPVPVEPEAWTPNTNPGLTGAHADNSRLQYLQLIDVSPHTGPEDVLTDESGGLIFGTETGELVRRTPDGHLLVIARLGGRPLSLAFDNKGAVLAATAGVGLMRVTLDGRMEVLTRRAAGKPIWFANDIVVTADDTVYFTDSSTRFNPVKYGGTYPASKLDILEHRPNGRLLAYIPETDETRVVLSELAFPNGLALSADGQNLYIAETAKYRILRYVRDSQQPATVLIDNLPGFPDNLNAGLDGRIWVGLVAPRNSLLDTLADKPLLRKMVQRLPEVLRPDAARYAHVFAFNDAGDVVADLQHDGRAFSHVTGVRETANDLYLSSLEGAHIAQLSKQSLELGPAP